MQWYVEGLRESRATKGAKGLDASADQCNGARAKKASRLRKCFNDLFIWMQSHRLLGFQSITVAHAEAVWNRITPSAKLQWPLTTFVVY